MQLIKKGSVEGVWFEFREDGAAAEEKPARFKVRRIPTGFDREKYFSHFGRKQEIKRKDGALISDIDGAKTQAYQCDLAVYALLDSERAEVPPEYAPGVPAGENGLALLDGKWTDDLRRAVFNELPALARWIVERANSLTAQAVEEESELGKTS